MKTLKNSKSDDYNKRNVQKCQNHIITPKHPETAECASSGMLYHVSQSLGEALTSYFMVVNLSTVHQIPVFENVDLLVSVILVYLVNERFLS